MMFGVGSMTAALESVALKRPGPALLNADASLWHYGPGFNPATIEAEHAAFVAILAQSVSEVLWIDGDDAGNADAVFSYDASLMTPMGAILMSPGKRLRAGEQNLHRAFYEKHAIAIIGAIEGDARAEAGDTLWLDESTLIAGRGFRTNKQGLEQLVTIMKSISVQVHTFDLPVYLGSKGCLHLMSLISLVDTKIALVCKPLLPVGLWELLLEKGFTLIEAPFEEFEQSNTLSTNVLATAPGKCIMIDGLPLTRSALSASGIHVQVFNGEALCIACEGGPTCLTRPLLRS
jgi:dimethylargininase